MPTVPDEPENSPPFVQRVKQAVPQRQRPVIGIAIVAALASLAPFPAGAVAVGLLVIVTFDRGRR